MTQATLPNVTAAPSVTIPVVSNAATTSTVNATTRLPSQNPYYSTTIQTLPKFAGEEGDDFATWIEQIQMDASFDSMPDNMKKSIMRSLLIGSARSIAVAQTPREYEAMSYMDWRQWLGKQVIPPNQRQMARGLKNTACQEPKESVKGWASRLRQIFRQANIPDDDEDEFGFHFWRGLRPDIESGVPGYMELSQMTRKAIQREAALKSTQAVAKHAAPASTFAVSTQPSTATLPPTATTLPASTVTLTQTSALADATSAATIGQLVAALQQQNQDMEKRILNHVHSANMEKRVGFNDTNRERFTTNGEPICDFCGHVGHFKYACRIRQRDMENGIYRKRHSDKALSKTQFAKQFPRDAERLEKDLARRKKDQSATPQQDTHEHSHHHSHQHQPSN